MKVDICPRCGSEDNKLIKRDVLVLYVPIDDNFGTYPIKELHCNKCGLLFKTSRKTPPSGRR